MNFEKLCVSSNTVGALTGFVSFPDNSIVGLSAFHVLSGKDRTINPSDDIVQVFDHQINDWRPFGRTIKGTYSAGNGLLHDFGLLDFGYFELSMSDRNLIQTHRKPIHLSRYFFSGSYAPPVGLRVNAYSIMGECVIYGHITHVYFQGIRDKYDVVIEFDENSFTYQGDSGILWKDEFGDALCMHLRGNSTSNSTQSFSSFMNRILTNGNSLFEYSDEQAT